MQKKALIFSTKHGHKSIAKAISESLTENNYQTTIYSQPGFVISYYVIIYKFLPFLNKVPYLVFKSDFLQQMAEIILRKKYQEEVETLIKKEKPDLVICNFWLFRPAVDAAMENSKIPYLNIVTDSWSAHPFIASPIAKNLAFDKKTATVINPDKEKLDIEVVGWFVRDEFEEKYDQKKLRKKLNLKTDKFTLLFAAGSEGSEQVYGVLEQLIDQDLPVQIVAICGRNKELLEEVKQLAKKDITNTSLLPLPFTKDISQYMKAADLIVGKAGPNSVFEAIATETPFFAITHISGQEDGNLEFIEKERIGFAEENANKATKILIEIIKNPQILDSFSLNIKKIKKYNQQTKQKLTKVIKDLNEKRN